MKKDGRVPDKYMYTNIIYTACEQKKIDGEFSA